MASLRDILARGLAEELDDKYNTDTDEGSRPEQTKPVPTEEAGIEPTLLAQLNAGVMGLTQTQILTGTLVLVGVIALVYYGRD